MHRFRPLALSAIAILATSGTAALIPYQGLATNERGVPVPDTTSIATFSLYDGPSTGTPLWRETQTVSVRKGLFSALLGDVVAMPDSLMRRSDLHLGVAFGGLAETRPRMRLGDAPYAVRARMADTARFAEQSSGQAGLIARLEALEAARKTDSARVARLEIQRRSDSVQIATLIGSQSTDSLKIQRIPLDRKLDSLEIEKVKVARKSDSLDVEKVKVARKSDSLEIQAVKIKQKADSVEVRTLKADLAKKADTTEVATLKSDMKKKVDTAELASMKAKRVIDSARIDTLESARALDSRHRGRRARRLFGNGLRSMVRGRRRLEQHRKRDGLERGRRVRQSRDRIQLHGQRRKLADRSALLRLDRWLHRGDQSMMPSGIVTNIAASVAIAAAASPAATLEWQRLGGTHTGSVEARSVAGGAFDTPAPDGEAGVRSGYLTHPYQVNSAPFLVGSLPDLRLERGTSHPGIGLDTVLVDLDGDTLAHSVESGILGASIQGRILRLETMVAGRHTVVVQARDGRFTTADTFEVEILASTSIDRRRVGQVAGAPTTLRIPGFLAVRSQGDGKGSLESPCEDHACLALDILLPGPGRIEVHILDHLGTPVMDLERRIGAQTFGKLARDEANRAVVPLTWNLRSREGRAVASGVYLWRIRVVTDAGEEFETIRRLGVRDPR